jgi:hypothetical protein
MNVLCVCVCFGGVGECSFAMIKYTSMLRGG